MSDMVESFLSELETLVNIDSGQGNPDGITAVGKYLADRLAASGWTYEQVDVGAPTGKCTVVKNHDIDTFDVMMIGHVDTVFPTGETAKRPFRRDEARAYGVGTLDMKQGALAIVYALERLPKDVLDSLDIAVIFNPDEEISSIYSKPLILDYAKRSRRALVYEAANTDGCHTLERKGRASFEVNFKGRAGHSGYMFDGGSDSAMHELIYWGSELLRLHSRETGTSVNIGVVSGGIAVNIVVEEACMRFESRYETNEERERLLSMIEALKLHAENAGIAVTVRTVSERPALVPTAAGRAFAERVRAACEREGMEFKLKKRGGVSDGNFIAIHCPVCLDGMGPTGDFDHSDREYLEISTIEPSIRLSVLALTEIANEKRGE